MKRKWGMFSLLVLMGLLPGYALQVNPVDSNAIQVKKFSPGTIASYRSDDDFDYETTPEKDISIWDIVLNFIARILGRRVHSPMGELTMYDILLYALIPFAAVLLVLQFFKVKAGGIFAQGPGQFATYQSTTENIHEMDLDEQIKQAVDSANYRLAIRLLYLKSLRRLTENGLIRWQKNKTNFEYYYELKDEGIRRQFYDLTLAFEYAWYGDFDISEEFYKDKENSFTGFIHSIRR